MAKAYSLDLRERVVAAALAGQPCRAVAATFKVSPSNVVKWVQLMRETGSLAPRPMGNRRQPVLAGERDWVLARLEEKPDITTRELAAELSQRGVKVGHVTVWKQLRKEKKTFKKNSARERAGPP